MRATEFVNEVGDSAYDVHHAETRKTKTKGRIRNAKMGMMDITGREFFNFSTPEGVNYSIGIHQFESSKRGTGIVVEFQNRDDKEFPYDRTGTGNEFTVFSTVRKVILKYLSEHPNVNFLAFSAKNTEPSRIRLYNAAASNPAKWFPGFTNVEKKNNGDLTQYTFGKTDIK